MTPVEWLHHDGIDARKDLLQGANVWLRAVGAGDIRLRPECSHWPMLQRLAHPDKDHAGELLRPPENFNFAQYFRDMIRTHEGEAKEVWGEWVYFKEPPPLSKNFHHCQYARTGEQMALMDRMRCRGCKLYKNEKVDWQTEAPLTCYKQLLDIGATTVCDGFQHMSSGTPENCGHWRRRAYVVTYTRLLCFLLEQKRIGMYEAEAWWNNARTICRYKGRQEKKKGKGKDRPEGKGQPGGKGQRRTRGNRKGQGKGVK